MPPSKMRFNVVHVSGEDPDNPARELHHHSPQTRGWQCPRFAKYPQEMTLQLATPANLAQIQILAHEYKIASKIEMFVGSLGAGESDLRGCQMKRLGYLSFDTNEASGFKARELKSVHVNTPAHLIKMVFHKCHVNKLNIYNQVGVIAVNIIGEAVGGGARAGGAGAGAGVVHNGLLPGGAAAQDIALDMNVDVLSAHKIREVMLQKEEAVQAENYDEAKRLKGVIDKLRTVGMKIAQLEAQKQVAVQKEDYDTAKILKNDIDSLRSGGHFAAVGEHEAPAYQPSFVDRGGVPSVPPPASRGSSVGDATAPAQQQPSSASVPPQTQHQPHQQHQDINLMPHDDRPAVATGILSGEVDRPETPARFRAVAAEDVEKRPVTTAKREARRAPEPAGPAPPAHVMEAAAPRAPSAAPTGAHGFPADLPAPEPLSAAAIKDAHGLDDILGEYTVMCLFSKNWVLRDAALQKIESQMTKEDFKDDPREVFKAICRIVSKFLRDKVANVFHSTLLLLKNSISKYSTELSAKEMLSALTDLIPVLVEKTGESNVRMREAAAETLAWMADSEPVGLTPLIGPLLKPLTNAAQWRPLLARMLLLTHLLPIFGIAHARPSPTDPPAFPLDNLMAFVNIGFTSSNGEVRNAAVKLTIEVYKKVGKAVDKFLPKTLKPAIRDVLSAGFEQVSRGEDPNAVEGAPHGSDLGGPAKRGSSVPGGGGVAAAGAGEAASVPAGGGGAPAATAVEATAPAAVTPADPAPVASSPAAGAAEDQEEEDEGPADVCQFCGIQDERLAQGENMDLHFYHDCPMLCSCVECGQIIEIASVNEHLLHECEQLSLYAECPRCMEAVRQADLEAHRQQNTCAVAKPPNMYNRCPLCHMDIPPHQEGWREHLLQGRGCPANTRSLIQQ